MLDQSSIPIIPKRPSAKASTPVENASGPEAPVDTPAVPRRPIARTDTGTTLSDLTVDPIDSERIPVIPQRPTRKSTTSSTSVTSTVDTSADLTPHAIPETTPDATEDLEPAADEVPVTAEATTNEVIDTPEAVESDTSVPDTSVDANAIIEDYGDEDDDIEAPLNCQSSVKSGGDNDGEKTPGNSNTKVSFKDDFEDDAVPGAGSDTTSFDDDQETVQDNDDSAFASLENHESEETEPAQTKPKEPIIPLRPERPILESNRSSSPIIPKRPVKPSNVIDTLSKGDTNTSASPVPFKSVSEVDTGSPVESISSPIIPQRPAKPIKKVDTGNEPVEKTDEKVHPIIPQRPAKAVASVDSEEKREPISTVISETSDKKSSDDLASFKDPGHAPTSSLPEIPPHPKKVEASSRNPASSSSESATDLKPKAPPPKPKKLSSKIAAFQQMFNQEPVEKPSSFNREPSNKPARAPGGLSSDKVKFAESLRGMMGRGIPLPGMAAPIPKPAAEEEQKGETDEEHAPVKEETKIAPRSTRAKGPKGKKLPNALKKPINMEVKSRFEIFAEDIWNVKFEKTQVINEKEVEEKNEASIPLDEKVQSEENQLFEDRELVEGDGLVNEPVEEEEAVEIPVEKKASVEDKVSAEGIAADEVPETHAEDSMKRTIQAQDTVKDQVNEEEAKDVPTKDFTKVEEAEKEAKIEFQNYTSDGKPNPHTSEASHESSPIVEKTTIFHGDSAEQKSAGEINALMTGPKQEVNDDEEKEDEEEFTEVTKKDLQFDDNVVNDEIAYVDLKSESTTVPDVQ